MHARFLFLHMPDPKAGEQMRWSVGPEIRSSKRQLPSYAAYRALNRTLFFLGRFDHSGILLGCCQRLLDLLLLGLVLHQTAVTTMRRGTRERASCQESGIALGRLTPQRPPPPSWTEPPNSSFAYRRGYRGSSITACGIAGTPRGRVRGLARTRPRGKWPFPQSQPGCP